MLQNFILIVVCTQSHIPCHCEAHSKWALHNPSLGVYEIEFCFKRYNLAVKYTLTQDASYTSHRQDPVGS